MRRICGLFLLFALAVTGCNLPAEGPTPTATLSSDDILRTAEAIAEMTRQAASPTPSPTPVTPTPTMPPETPTPTLTATPSVPMATANYNANVRRGPDESYEVIDFFLQGQQARIAGRYDNPVTGTWWFLRREGQGLDGWVWGGAVTVSGDTSGVPFLTPPPTSTPSPEPTSPPAPTDTPAPPTPTETPTP